MIRQLIALSLIVAGASACESSTTPSRGETETTYRFRADMTAAQEIPLVTGVEANASGTANITFNLTRNSNNVITGGTVDFGVTLAGFPAGTAINAAHIHPGFAGNTGGIQINTGLVPGDVTLANGTGGFTRNGISGIGADVLASIIANPAGFYFNVHSQLNPQGAVRGQLVLQ